MTLLHQAIRRTARPTVVVAIVATAGLASLGAQERSESVRAFLDVATVLSSPRCANCHITQDTPLQGEDSHAHTMNVRRGSDGRGTPAMRCTNCHQRASLAAPNTPPGAPDWRLPPPATPMAWHGRSAGDQCRMLKDPRQNGGRTLPDLLQHARTDPLVLAAWSPGPGRALPPLSHDAFVERFETWIRLGASCPNE